MRVILLGPQRRPTVDVIVRSLGLAGPLATVTAGWQEREPDDAELNARLGGRGVSLELYRRWLDVQERDPEYAAAERAVAGVLAELQDLYLLRLDYALQAVYALQHSGPADSARAGALAEAVAAVRELDAAQLRRVNEVRGEFFARLQPHDRPVIAEHRAAVAGQVSNAAALIMAGGHVGVLAEVLHLFNLAATLQSAGPSAGPSAGQSAAGHSAAGHSAAGHSAAGHSAAGHSAAGRSAAGRSAAGRSAAGRSAAGRSAAGRSAAGRPPVIAWSAGAMALTDRVVLFGDRTPHGPGHPEVYGSGLSVVRDVVLLPHARARLLLDDTPRMAAFARRFAPARCVLLEAGARVEFPGDGAFPPGARVLGENGHVSVAGGAA